MANPNPLRHAVAAWRSATATAVSHRFAVTLDKALTALMDRAEKAQNNNQQASYFHAQQELRHNRDAVQQRFDETLASRIKAEPSPDQGKPAQSAGELKLVNPDTFERLVVLETLGERAEQRYHTVLHELGHRLSVLYRGAVVTPNHIPAAPKQLLDSFDDATYKLDIEQHAWQVLAAVFDVTLLRTLQSDYDMLNDALRNAGVLPNLKPTAIRNPETATEGPPQARKPTAPPSTPVDPTRDIAHIRALMSHGHTSPSVSETGRMQAADIAELIENSQTHLLALLPDHGLFDGGLGIGDIDADQLQLSQRAMQAQRVVIKQQIGPDQLSRHDESTIDIIGALFDAMLNESDLCAPIKALLSHLHTPYLKLAMREPDLLTNTGHPARQLLDEMVRAGELWGDGNHLGQGVFPMLKELVAQLRGAQTLSRPHLEKLRAQLIRHTGELRRRRDQRGERATEAEIGRAKLAEAKTIADEHVQELIGEASLCAPCREFLRGPWHDYLTLLLVRNDGQPGGNGWSTSQALGAQIARLSGATKDTAPPPQTLDALHRHLTNSLGHLIPHYRADIDTLITALRAWRATTATTPQRPQDTAPPARRMPTPGGKGEQLTPPLIPDELALVDKLRELSAGSAFRFHTTNHQPARLLTVTWFNPNTDRLMFVDQRGAKADLLSVQRLARLIHQDMAYAVDESEARPPFVSRALHRLREYLENNRWLTPGAPR